MISCITVSARARSKAIISSYNFSITASTSLSASFTAHFQAGTPALSSVGTLGRSEAPHLNFVVSFRAKRVQFGYGLNYMIDVEHAVIVDVEATPARTYDEVAASRTMIDRTETTFGLKPGRLAADTAYGTGKLLAWLRPCALRSPNMSPNGVGHVTVRCGLAQSELKYRTAGYVRACRQTSARRLT
jgi:hypothetical protein